MSTPLPVAPEPDLRAPALEIPINVCGDDPRPGQLFTLGVPVPIGYMNNIHTPLGIACDGADATRVQTRVLGYWPDGSVKWLLVCFLSEQLGSKRSAVLRPLCHSHMAQQGNLPQIAVSPTTDGFSITSGEACIRLAKGERLLDQLKLSGERWLGESGCRLICYDKRGNRHVGRMDSLVVEEAGPYRVTFAFQGSLGRTGLRISVRESIHAGSNRVQMQVTIENPRRARHRGGLWDLGDPGSVLLQSLRLELQADKGLTGQLRWQEQPDGEVFSTPGKALEIYQESSGGKYWNSRNHVNRHGRIPFKLRGYRVYCEELQSDGDRASPILALRGDNRYMTCAIEEFWQKFPSALEVRGEHVMIYLWPEQFPDLFELQGGEHCTRTVWIDWGIDRGAAWKQLAGIYDSPSAVVAPAWIAASSAVPFFSVAPSLRPEAHAILASALDGEQSFFAKREAIDEYGWRNFGDCWADHEQTYAADPRPVISHYNNQYDLLHGLLVQYLQTDDIRWWRLADPLARHVMDVDIYHTDRDKSGYSGGLFWHTNHYRDAGRSTHRTHSVDMRGKALPGTGGGPANEHNYTSGLLLYHVLTGDERALGSVVGLADWAIKMDAGEQHLLGIASNHRTGLASCTTEPGYHGPGRGAGNTINALLDGWLATGQRQYVDKCDEILRRTIHPNDAIPQRDLLNAEPRWSYTVYLQVLLKMLEMTRDAPEWHETRDYARQSVLHYAGWMLTHERAYLDSPAALEYPTETWAAQDLRKGNVLLGAARITTGSAAESLRERGHELLDKAWKSLQSFPTHIYTRPLALVLQQVYQESFLSNDRSEACHQKQDCEYQPQFFNSHPPFVPLKTLLKAELCRPAGLLRVSLHCLRPRGWYNALRRTWIAEIARRLLYE